MMSPIKFSLNNPRTNKVFSSSKLRDKKESEDTKEKDITKENRYNMIVNIQRSLLLSFVIEEQKEKVKDCCLEILPLNSHSSVKLNILNSAKQKHLERNDYDLGTSLSNNNLKSKLDANIASNITDQNGDQDILIPKRSNKYSSFPNITSYLDNTEVVKKMLEKASNK